MSALKNVVKFDDSPELMDRLLGVIDSLKDEKGALIPILQQAQNIYGYLPIEVQKVIAEKMNIPLEKIYGVITFYSFFSLYPKGKYKISVCLGTACYVKGAGQIFSRLQDTLGLEAGQCTPDQKFSLDSCRCIGACGLAPVVLVNDDVYGHLTPGDVQKILEKYE